MPINQNFPQINIHYLRTFWKKRRACLIQSFSSSFPARVRRSPSPPPLWSPTPGQKRWNEARAALAAVDFRLPNGLRLATGCLATWAAETESYGEGADTAAGCAGFSPCKNVRCLIGGPRYCRCGASVAQLRVWWVMNFCARFFLLTENVRILARSHIGECSGVHMLILIRCVIFYSLPRTQSNVLYRQVLCRCKF